MTNGPFLVPVLVPNGSVAYYSRQGFPKGSRHLEVRNSPLVEGAEVSTTAAQKKAQAKAEYNAFLSACPSHKLLDRLSNKWVALVLSALGSGCPQPPGATRTGDPRSMRYSELSRLLVGVSQKMLTQTLRSLERDGLVTRTVVPTVPITVSYELTELGQSLHHMVRGLKAWAEAHMDDVFASRAIYDAGESRT